MLKGFYTLDSQQVISIIKQHKLLVTTAVDGGVCLGEIKSRIFLYKFEGQIGGSESAYDDLPFGMEDQTKAAPQSWAYLSCPEVVHPAFFKLIANTLDISAEWVQVILRDQAFWDEKGELTLDENALRRLNSQYQYDSALIKEQMDYLVSGVKPDVENTLSGQEQLYQKLKGQTIPLLAKHGFSVEDLFLTKVPIPSPDQRNSNSFRYSLMKALNTIFTLNEYSGDKVYEYQTYYQKSFEKIVWALAHQSPKDRRIILEKELLSLPEKIVLEGVYFKVSEGKANLLKKINYGEERFHKNSRGKVA
ncbi:MAG: hypothetical protein GY810_15920 [Aureispira sp.]|nr:hypothetical protein [Aureispira sp.]